MSTPETIKTSVVGVLGSIFTWIIGAANWYNDNLLHINDWLVHLAQLGGLIVVFLSIKILRRNWKKGIIKHKALD